MIEVFRTRFARGVLSYMSQPTKRYSLVLPASLHKLVVRCARDGTPMVDLMRRLLEQEFGEQDWKDAAPRRTKSKSGAPEAIR